jgi:hypothetical protein
MNSSIVAGIFSVTLRAAFGAKNTPGLNDVLGARGGIEPQGSSILVRARGSSVMDRRQFLPASNLTIRCFSSPPIDLARA